MTPLTSQEIAEIEARAVSGASKYKNNDHRAGYIIGYDEGATSERIKSKAGFAGLKTQVGASRLMMGPEDDYKKGWNDALTKAMSLIKQYQDGEGLFQEG